MITNLNCKILTGKYTHAEAEYWDKEFKLNDCPYYLFYMPFSDTAEMVIDDKTVKLETGKIYFISGWHILSRECREFIDMAWLHFIPESLELNFLLTRCPRFFELSDELYQQSYPIMTKLKDFKVHPFQLTSAIPDPFRCRIHGLLNFVIAEMLEHIDKNTSRKEIQAVIDSQKAIRYMDIHFLESPKLEKIAQEVNQSPIYFHRMFKKTFNLTPWEYMLNLRMNHAKELLHNSTLRIKEIAEKAGYKNEFHFSKAFKQHAGVSPREYRKTQN